MLLAAIIKSTNNSRGQHLTFLTPSPGISESLDLLDFLAGYHNQAARARRDQIQRLYDHIPALIESLHASTEEMNTQSPLSSSRNQAVPTPRSTGDNLSSQQPSSYENPWDFESSGGVVDRYASASLQMPFPSDAQTMYSLYQGDDFILTGADVADFEELQRHLLGSDTAF